MEEVTGSNILRRVKDIIQEGHKEGCYSWAPLFKWHYTGKIILISRVKVCGHSAILIPAWSAKQIKCSVRVAPTDHSYEALVEEGEVYHPPLHKGLVVCHTFVTVDDTGVICIEVTNLSVEDLYLQSRTADSYEVPRVNIVDVMAEEVLVVGQGKDQSRLGFLQRNLKIGNKKTKETAYKTLVRPLLEYAATVWDPYTASENQAIEKVQRRAARWVSNRHRQTSCVDNMLDSLDWQTLQRRKKARLEMLYKFHHSLISISSSHLPKPSGCRLSSRRNNTCSYDIPSCRTQYRQMSFFPRTILDWNGLPQEAVMAESLDSFKSRLDSLL